MTLLELKSLSKSYGAIEAVIDFDLALSPGTVLGLVGDNGAGKSTLVKMICGNVEPTSGEILLEGSGCQFTGPADARRAGIEVVHQDLGLCPNLSAAANVFLGREETKRFGPFRWLDRTAMNARARELFQQLQSDTVPERLVKGFSGGQRQAVAIARTLLANAKLVILDEPTAAISVRQVAQVLELVKRLRDSGVTVILISHRMPDIFEVCDRVVVMRRGIKVSDKAVTSTNPEEVTALITGALDAA